MSPIYDDEDDSKYIIPQAMCLGLEYAFFLVVLRCLSYCNIIYGSATEGKYFTNSTCIIRGRVVELMFVYARGAMCTFVFGSVLYFYFVNASKNWNTYMSWSRVLGSIYFFIVTIYAGRKLSDSPHPRSDFPLKDPNLTKLTNLLFVLLVPVSFVASGLSLIANKSFIFLDHLVTLCMLIEMTLNSFRVDVGDIFFSVTVSIVYISFVWLTSSVFDIRDWPKPVGVFKLNTWWCIFNYNMFVLSHIACFFLFHIYVNFICLRPHQISVQPKIEMKKSLTSEKLPSDDGNYVFPVEKKLSERDLKIQEASSSHILSTKSDPKVHKQYSETRLGSSNKTTSSSVKQLDDIIDNEAILNELAKQRADFDATEAALKAQLISERTDKKKLINETNDLRNEIQQLKEENNRNHFKLERMVDKLGEKDLELKNLEQWLAAKSDEELAKIKMQMAEKLNAISARPKTADDGVKSASLSKTLHNINPMEPVQTKNLQAWSAVRNLKNKKQVSPEKMKNFSDEGAHEIMYKTL